MIAATRSNSGKKNIKRLESRVRRVVDQEGAGVRLQYLDEDDKLANTGYRLFFVSHTSFMVLECPNRVRLQPEEADQLFYDSLNPGLIPTASWDKATVEHFEALRDHLDDARRFFDYMDNPTNSSDIEFCDNLCPSGFQAVESLGVVNGTGICNRRNKAVEPFFNQSNFDYTYACTPCDNKYRYAFPLEKLTGVPGYEFLCQYDCKNFTTCQEPFVIGINGTTIHDTVCDCPGDNLRLVISPPQLIDQVVVPENNTLVLTEANESERARYSELGGDEDDYDFLCVTRSYFCEAYNQSGQLQLGFQYSYDNAPSHCFIPITTGTTYSVFEGVPQDNILTLEYRPMAPEISTEPAGTESYNSTAVPSSPLSANAVSVSSTPTVHEMSTAALSTKQDSPSTQIAPSTTSPAIKTATASGSSAFQSTGDFPSSANHLIVTIPGSAPNSSVTVAGPTDSPFGSNLPLIIGVVAATAISTSSLIISALVGGLLCMKLRQQHYRVGVYSGSASAGMVLNPIYSRDNDIYTEAPGPEENMYETIGPGSRLTSEFLRAAQQAAVDTVTSQSLNEGETASVKNDETETYTVMNAVGSIKAVMNQLTGD